MILATLCDGELEEAAVQAPHGWIKLSRINEAFEANWPLQIGELIASGRWEALSSWYKEEGEARLLLEVEAVPETEVAFGLLYRNPRKIWGIGMNYRPSGEPPAPPDPGEEPVSFMKPDTTLIGPGEPVRLPRQAERVTAEAELAIVIGKVCRNVSEEEAPDYVAGFATALDMTAADIHEMNPRYLTRAKSFDTFLSIGPQLLTVGEIEDVHKLEISTVLNGTEVHRNTVSQMRFRPWWIVAFHSRVMTLLPGDIILTGTPGPVIIRAGDEAQGWIEGFLPLINPVAAD
ncbi:fumarylacetoacetate hydrolase family protein [Paenibacillus sp. OV219]|uniref:fumarylacetoacetate hydrolase family protein n=1 Tax=Paenibacillus sp. OV219 TaxID=1884377 RepID=UPI0008CABCD0|nr:fumarylacetoacetate hydrolase family protein [Paenibacillus sp. OV219]SEO76637.1 2-keto-4-pentenoate hydratase/2-oxohepta-3-ene-1,7-dioic acid hydratase (catechol pathway) [Paenibacillus sp. OV219]